MCVLRRGIDMSFGLEAILELYRLEALLKLCSDGGIIHIKGITVGVIIGCTAIIIIIIVIHNVGMCGSIPSGNRSYRGWCCYVGGDQLGELTWLAVVGVLVAIVGSRVGVLQD